LDKLCAGAAMLGLSAMLGFRFACQRHQEIFVDTVERLGPSNAEQMENVRRRLLARLSEKFPLLVLDCFNTKSCIGCALSASGLDATQLNSLVEEVVRASKVALASS